MRILWVCNIIIPRIAKELNAEIRNIGGWLTGICDSLINDEEISLSICFPFVKNIRGDSCDHFPYSQCRDKKSEISTMSKIKSQKIQNTKRRK